jgi:protoheme IX farnesyltransferase
MPFAIRMSGPVYLLAAVILSGLFICYAWRLYRQYSDDLARKLFRYSILYLSLLFGALLVDHWIQLIA